MYLAKDEISGFNGIPHFYTMESHLVDILHNY